MHHALVPLVVLTAALASLAAEAQSGEGAGSLFRGYSAGEFKGMSYRWMKPPNCDAKKSYPLVLSLHGRAGVGTDNRENLRGWNTTIINRDEWREEHPCFVLAPQNDFAWVRPATVKASVQARGGEAFVAGLDKKARRYVRVQLGKPDYSGLAVVFDLIAKFREDFSVDGQRIYVIGNSMGGYGAWAAMQEEPDLFAAGVAACGGQCIHLGLDRIKHVPVWAFHGTADKIVPYEKSRKAFEELKKLGGNCKLTSLKGQGHGIWRIAFRYAGDNPAKGYTTEYSSEECDREGDVWQWLFSQRKPAAAGAAGKEGK